VLLTRVIKPDTRGQLGGGSDTLGWTYTQTRTHTHTHTVKQRLADHLSLRAADGEQAPESWLRPVILSPVSLAPLAEISVG